MAGLTSTQPVAERAGRGGLAGALWLVQAISGLLLVALLLLHMIAHHFVVEGGLRDYEQVLDYVANPIIFFLEVVFLVVVTAHAMLGLRAITLDMNLKAATQRTIDWALGLIGVIALGYGIWLAIALQRL